MKWLIASDIHGSEYYCRKVLETFDREGAERMLLLGDVLYHGPRNDLPRDYCPRAVAELLNAREGSVIGVRGNCDAEIDQAVLHFPILADYALLYARSGLRGKRRDLLSQPRLCGDPEGKLAPQRHDAGGRGLPLDRS